LELLNNGVDVEETGTELALALTQGPGWLSYLTTLNEDPNLDIVAGKGVSNAGKISALSSVSCAEKTSHVLLSLLYSVTNNLLPRSKALEVFPVISRGINRKFFKALIAKYSPTTKSIARLFLPAAIGCVDASMVKTLLATGIDANFDVGPMPRHSLFVTAISSGNVDIVQHFLDHGAHVKVSSDSWKYTPLEAAAITGRLDLVRLLLQAGAGLNVAERNHGSSALCFAAKYGELELVQLLVDAGADVRGTLRRCINIGYRRTRPTVLSFAVERADIAMAEYLISCGADVNVLGDAVSVGNMEMLQLLLTHGANNVREAMTCGVHSRNEQVVRLLVRLEFDKYDAMDEDFWKSALEAAIYCNDVELLTWLLDFGIGVSVTPAVLKIALETAVREGHLSITKLLIARGACINADSNDLTDQTILQFAVEEGHRHLVEFLLRSGADVHARGHWSAEMVVAKAIEQHQTEVVQLLLASGVDMNRQGPPAVLAAIEVASPELLRVVLDAWLLTGDIDMVGWVDEDGETPFGGKAIHCANVELTQLLIDYRVTNAENASAALPRAVEDGDLEVVRLLLASGAHVGRDDDQSSWYSDTHGSFYMFATALDRAAEGGNMEILNLLLQHPTTVEERSQALQVAASRNNLDAVISLLDHGVNVNAAPFGSAIYFPPTALQAAAENGDLKLVRCLLDAGAAVESMIPSTRENRTALQFAATAGSINIVVALIQRGADLRAPAMEEALEGAAAFGRLDTVQLLINMGAGVTGSRAVRYARRYGYDAVVELLLNNGFEENADMSEKNRRCTWPSWED
jgi:ankyrin repeat protein